MEIIELKNQIKNLVDKMNEEDFLNEYYAIPNQSIQLNLLPKNEQLELLEMVDNPQNFKFVSHKTALDKLSKWKGK